MQFDHVADNLVRDPDYLDRLLTEADAARFLGFSVRAMQGWRLKGGGPPYLKIGGKSVRYRRRELIPRAEENLRANTSGP